jgi:rhodanese-related sulfurtransferase
MRVIELPRKQVPPPMELVKGRIEESLPPEIEAQVAAGEIMPVDTRDPERFDKGRIPGAVNVPAGANGIDSRSPEFAERFARAAEGRPALLYCGTGNRSARATDALTNEHEVEGARSLIGGIKLWSDLGLPVDGTVELDAEEISTDDDGEG